jgi:hypothetical protein
MRSGASNHLAPDRVVIEAPGRCRINRRYRKHSAPLEPGRMDGRGPYKHSAPLERGGMEGCGRSSERVSKGRNLGRPGNGRPYKILSLFPGRDCCQEDYKQSALLEPSVAKHSRSLRVRLFITEGSDRVYFHSTAGRHPTSQ